MSFKEFINEKEYKYTGKEKHLFDFKPQFKIGEKVKINKKLKLYVNTKDYNLDYAYVYDILHEDENSYTYHLCNDRINCNYIINHTKRNGPFNDVDNELRFKEEDLKLMEK